MSNIVLARKKLMKMANDLREEGEAEYAAEIEDIVDGLMHRRKPVRKAPTHSVPVTDEVKRQIRRLAENPNLHSSEIAAQVGVNPGRVSEVLQGDR